VFVLENFVPDLTRFERGQRTDMISISADAARIHATIHDAVNQRCYV
jgi:hypothetical protein